MLFLSMLRRSPCSGGMLVFITVLGCQLVRHQYEPADGGTGTNKAKKSTEQLSAVPVKRVSFDFGLKMKKVAKINATRAEYWTQNWFSQMVKYNRVLSLEVKLRTSTLPVSSCTQISDQFFFYLIQWRQDYSKDCKSVKHLRHCCYNSGERERMTFWQRVPVFVRIILPGLMGQL